MSETTTLSQQLEEYRAGWRARVPADRQAVMDRHIAHLRCSGAADRALKVGQKAPPIVLANATGKIVDVALLLAQGPVIVTFYRGGWCPFCNMELRAYQALLPRITAAGAHVVAISPETPDETLSTAEKNALSFEVLSDTGHKVAKSFGLYYEFTDELRTAYDGFKLDIPAKNGTPGEWALDMSGTYVIGQDGTILFADAGVDYRERVDPLDVLAALGGK
jgi:peroxiredoxin